MVTLPIALQDSRNHLPTWFDPKNLKSQTFENFSAEKYDSSSMNTENNSFMAVSSSIPAISILIRHEISEFFML